MSVNAAKSSLPANGSQPVTAIEGRLADFSTDRRVLLLASMAMVIGGISSLVAYALLWLIAVITNLAFYQRFSTALAVPQGHHLGYWVVAVPVIGRDFWVITLEGARGRTAAEVEGPA